MKRINIVLIVILSLTVAFRSNASSDDIEKKMQARLIELKRLLDRPPSDQERTDRDTLTGELERIGRAIEQSDAELKALFAQRSSEIATLGSLARDRQKSMERDYDAKIRDVLSGIDAVGQGSVAERQQLVEELNDLLASIASPGSTFIYGTLPYQHGNWAAHPPLTQPTVLPAYRGGNGVIGAGDLAHTDIAPISMTIAEAAQSLEWNPVKIYQWVKNTVQTEWYWGCMKGAEETLRQQSGNDCDQAALLVALLRASGYPARFVRGLIEVGIGTGELQALLGVGEPRGIGQLFQKAGTPFKTIVAGGKIDRYQFEHIWIETEVPYANYRGVVIDDHGKSWLGLDTSIKVQGYDHVAPTDVHRDFPLADVRAGYLSSDRDDTPLEYLKSELQHWLEQHHPGVTYDELPATRQLKTEVLNLLPAGLQFKDVLVTGEYTDLPPELVFAVQLAAYDRDGTVLFQVERPLYELANRLVALSFEPETIADQEIINAYGGLDYTPSYLVRLRPVLLGDEERLGVAADGLAVGEPFDIEIGLSSPRGEARSRNRHLVGNSAVIGIVAQQPAPPGEPIDETATASRLLHEVATGYVSRWNEAEEELAALFHQTLVRPMPTVVTVGGVVDVAYLLDTALEMKWKGAYLDADYRVVETVGGLAMAERSTSRTFTQLSSLQGSALEHQVFEERFGVDGISTAKLFGLAHAEEIEIVRIDGDNLEEVLPTLPFADPIKGDIGDAINAGLVVQLPAALVTYEDWSGVGYVKENPRTGESGWMLSGLIAGGMTAWRSDRWDDYYKDRLSNPFSEPPNLDPAAAQFIQKIASTDLQQGKVGERLPAELEVIVRDTKMRPVKGATVTFAVKTGNGFLNQQKLVYPIRTDAQGVARVWLTLGKRTADNPTYWWEEDGDFPQQVGENIVSARLDSGVSTATPFTAYGFPQKAAVLRKIHWSEEKGYPLAFMGFVSAVVEDEYGNNLSNVPMVFSVGDGIATTTCNEPPPAGRGAALFRTDDPCLEHYPVFEQCATSAELELKSSLHGAAAQVFLGGAASTDYPIQVTAEGLTKQFTLSTREFGNCTGASAPRHQLFLAHSYKADSAGNLIDAAKPGDTLPLYAQMHFLSEQGKTEESYGICGVACDLGEEKWDQFWGRCEVFHFGTQQFSQRRDFKKEEVYFGDQLGLSHTGGVYSTDYRVEPGVNEIPVRGKGKITVTWPQVTICENDFEPNDVYVGDFGLVARSEIKMKVYGVDVLVPSPLPIAVDQAGYVRADRTIPYTITPAQYNAVDAHVFVYEGDTLIAAIPAEKQGSGVATIAAGFKFDLDNGGMDGHTAVVVLNYGSQHQIKSEPIALRFLNVTASPGPFELQRVVDLTQFDSELTGLKTAGYTDGYQAFQFGLGYDADATVKLFNAAGDELKTIVPKTRLPVGAHKFVVDFETIHSAQIQPAVEENFYLQLEVIAAHDENLKDIFQYPGKLAIRLEGKTLGQMVVHDVMIQDGSLNLSQTDISMGGRGPTLELTRFYNNQGKAASAMGPGWRHSLEKTLTPLSSAENPLGPVPPWVVAMAGKFYSPNAIVEPHTWTYVRVNGTGFKNYLGAWYPERGRHGKLALVEGQFVYTAKDGTRYRYPYPDLRRKPTGVTTIEDPNGNAMTFDYNSNGRLSAVEDAVGRTLHFEYLSYTSSTLTRVTGPDGIEITYEYDDDKQLARVLKNNRRETKYEYHKGNLSKVIDTNGNAFAYEYYADSELEPMLPDFLIGLDAAKIVKKVIYPDLNFAEFLYDTSGENGRTVVDLRGNPTEYLLNFFGNPKEITYPLGKTEKMTWSIDEGKDDNVMTSVTDARGNTTTFEHDVNGNVRIETDPYGRQIVTEWDPVFNKPLSRTDRNGVSQYWDYDESTGNLMTYTDGDQKDHTYTYYDTGELHTETDPKGYTKKFTYDRWGYPDIVAHGGALTDYDYDVKGRKIVEIDSRGNRTTHHYDDLDQLVRIEYPRLVAYTLPEGSATSAHFAYDAEGNLLSKTDRVGLKRAYTYTGRNQIETITRSNRDGSALYGEQRFGYDENGNTVSQTDWKGVATTHTYNELDQRVTTTNRLGDTMVMAYDLAGNLIQSTDYEGRVSDFAYDKLNRLTDSWEPQLHNHTERGYLERTYYHEADGTKNLKTVSNQEGHTTTYEYNGRYLKTKQTDPLGGVFEWQYDDNGNLVETIDEALTVTTHGYDNRNRKQWTRSMDNATTSFGYDDNNNLTHVIDPLHNETITRYDNWNRPYRIIDPADHVVLTAYDGEGNPVKTTDGRGNITRSYYDELGRLSRSVDGENNPTRYQYDVNGNEVEITYANGAVTQKTYDGEDRLRLTVEAVGQDEERSVEILEYDKVGNPLRVRDYNGNVVETVYNSLNLPWKVIDPLLKVTEQTYYRDGKLERVIDRRGHRTHYLYDALNRETTIIDALDQSIVKTYDAVGNLETITNKKGVVTEHFYDQQHRLDHSVVAGVRIVKNEYDPAGNLRFATDALGHRTEYRYNSRGLLQTTIFPDLTTESRTYDEAGNLGTVTDEEDKVTTYTYDNANRPKTITFAGELTETFYDEMGNVTELRDPKLTSKRTAYDRLNRVVSVTEDPGGLNLQTRYTYDANGNLTHQIDPSGHHVSFSYDGLNRKTEHIQHKSGGNLTTRYTVYDNEGNLKEVADPKGQVFTYDYDLLNRQTDKYYPATASPYLRIDHIHTEYDENNNITALTETKTTTDNEVITESTGYRYDEFDRVIEKDERGFVIEYRYDDNGNRTWVQTDGGLTEYTYDALNRLETAIVDGSVTVYEYTLDGKKSSVSYPNDTTVTYTYFPANRVATIENTHTDGTVISRFDYEYDKNGNRTVQIELQNGTAETTEYHYDAVNRLVDFTITGPQTVTTTAYTYQGYNRKTETVARDGSPTKSRTYHYDETNWLISIDDDVQQKEITYLYDDNGNTVLKSDSSLADQDIAFSYNAKDQLVQTARGLPGTQEILGRYDYDANGLRIRHLDSERGDVLYYYDGPSIIEERDAGDDSLIAHYRYADRLLSLDTGVATQYFHHDVLGTTSNLTDDAGEQIASYRLDPWGKIRQQEGTSVNRQLFTGQEHDEKTGLIYFGARYYDPDTARFITQDSYLGKPGTPPSLHRYLYAYSNPMVYIDRQGHRTRKWYDFITYGLRETSNWLKSKISTATDFYGNNTVSNVAEGLLYTFVDVGTGFVEAPINTIETITNDSVNMYYDPKLKNLPVLGRVGQNLGTSAGDFIVDPNVETGAKLVAATADTVQVAAGGVDWKRNYKAKTKPLTQPKEWLKDKTRIVRRKKKRNSAITAEASGQKKELPTLDEGYHYRHYESGEVKIARNPGKAGSLPKKELVDGQVRLVPPPIEGRKRVPTNTVTGQDYHRRLKRFFRRFEGKKSNHFEFHSVERKLADGMQTDWILVDKQNKKIYIYDLTIRENVKHRLKGKEYVQYVKNIQQRMKDSHQAARERYSATMERLRQMPDFEKYKVEYREKYWENVTDHWEALDVDGNLYLPKKKKE